MNGLQAYKDTAITTQPKGRLIVLLYEGAIKFLKLAIERIEAKDFEDKGRYICKAQDIINELNAVLDMGAGGEIGENLRRLYAFMTRRLFEANMKRDPQMVREVIRLLEDLNQGWRAIAD
jgi:flagellar protein FliS